LGHLTATGDGKRLRIASKKKVKKEWDERRKKRGKLRV